MHRFPPLCFILLWLISRKFTLTILLYKQVSFKHGGTTRLCDVRSRASYFCALALYWIIDSKRWHFYSMSVILVHSCDFPQHSTTRHPAKIISAFCSCFSFLLLLFFFFLPSCLFLLSCLSNPLTLLMDAVCIYFLPKHPSTFQPHSHTLSSDSSVPNRLTAQWQKMWLDLLDAPRCKSSVSDLQFLRCVLLDSILFEVP